MSPPRRYEDVERSLFRSVKSVILKPAQKPLQQSANTCANFNGEQPKPSVKTRTVQRVVLEGQSGDDNRHIRVRIHGNDYDYFDAFVPQGDLVLELLPRLRHSVVESLKITNFRHQMTLDDDLLTKLCIIFRTVSVTEEVAVTETWFGGSKGEVRSSMNRLMNCFESFRPKSLDIWHSTGMKLDNKTLQRFRESGIHCISVA
ncbi:hypothetical protein AAVH_25902 [Aphelenchoides avenae]|nr:hypothetical protein AAVH_25902 [Aphelenchus avenae]